MPWGGVGAAIVAVMKQKVLEVADETKVIHQTPASFLADHAADFLSDVSFWEGPRMTVLSIHNKVPKHLCVTTFAAVVRRSLYNLSLDLPEPHILRALRPL